MIEEAVPGELEAVRRKVHKPSPHIVSAFPSPLSLSFTRPCRPPLPACLLLPRVTAKVIMSNGTQLIQLQYIGDCQYMAGRKKLRQLI